MAKDDVSGSLAREVRLIPDGSHRCAPLVYRSLSVRSFVSVPWPKYRVLEECMGCVGSLIRRFVQGWVIARVLGWFRNKRQPGARRDDY